MYRLSECHETGIDATAFAGLLRRAELDVTLRFHWYGLSPLTDAVFGRRFYSRGWAPLVSVVATKATG